MLTGASAYALCQVLRICAPDRDPHAGGNHSNHTSGLFRTRRNHGSTSTDGRSWAATKVIMSISLARNDFKAAWLIPALLFALCTPMLAQGPTPVSWRIGAFEPAPVAPVQVSFSPAREAPRAHHFFDRKNQALFAGVVATSTADFYVTHLNLAAGGRELNPITRVFCGSAGGLALSFVGESASVIGMSYLFHRTGHHRLERMTAVVNIGSSAAAVTYSATHH
jgi:hypothetical protein